jgi:alkanesulfonate monooxygenase SsuD/methylene tetrahydromethanopterin reductase-like flavin-dependent oxidoreductase (luciferase family)
VRYGVVLFTSDRGITPRDAAKAAEDNGFDTFYVPEHTHIPVKREAAHPGTGTAELPDDRYSRTLDPWVSLATAAAVTSRIRLSTAVALPVESDPITLAKAIATLDHLSGGRVQLGAGGTDKTFDWICANADGWINTPREVDVADQVLSLRKKWSEAGRSGEPQIVFLGGKPDPDNIKKLEDLGVTECAFGMPDKEPAEVVAYLERLAGKLPH